MLPVPKLSLQCRWPALAIWTLFQIGVAYPVLGLLSRYPEFFHTRHSSASELWWLVVVLCAVLPLLLIVTQRLVTAIHGGSGRALFAVLMIALWLLVVLSMMPEALSPGLRAVLAIAVALLMAAVSLFNRVGAWFLLYLSPAVLIVPVLFLASPGIRPLLATAEREAITGSALDGTAQVAGKGAGKGAAEVAAEGATPIVFVVFDELPTNALLDGEGGINRAWFPGFAALADTANWYPNATTVAASTVLALPAILTGRFPESFLLPHHGEYPDNLFTLLADSHAMNVDESVTGMCPARVCGARRQLPTGESLRLLLEDVSAVYLNITLAPLLPGRFPPINQSWSGFWMKDPSRTSMYTDRLARLEDWSRPIGRTTQDRAGQTTLNFTHLTFPHIPYEFLPSGQRYTDSWLLPGLDTPTQTWTGSEWQSRQAVQRFTLQLQAIDRWLGALLTQLKDEGRFDETLIVVTADHGVSFEPGNGRRDAPSLANLEANILPVPLFIKLPQQQRGEVSLRNAESIDILPTLAQLLGREIPWAVDGVSLLAEPRPAAKRAAYQYREMTVHQTDTEAIATALRGGWQHKTFLDLAANAGVDAPWQLASQPGLLGRALADLTVEISSELELSIQDPQRFDDVDPDSDLILPVFLGGQVAWPGEATFDVVIALNGKLFAVVEPWGSDERLDFAALLPSQALRKGANEVNAYVVRRPHDPASPLVAAASARPPDRWTWDPEQGVLQRNGKHLEFVTEGLDGEVEMVDSGASTLEILGWAMDTRNEQTVGKVLFFSGSELLGQTATLMLHHRTFEHDMVINLGFHAVIEREHPRQDAESLVVIAVSQDGRARRLERAVKAQP